MKSKQAGLLGLGTAAIGRPQYINIRQEETSIPSLEVFREKGLKILEEAYKKGVRYFDTAPGYGMAEQLLIDWVADKNDESIEIATKWGYTYVANFKANATQHEVKEHSLEKLNEQWEQSKFLLPNLSNYQVHSASFETGILSNRPILNRLAELKNEHDLLIGITTSGANQKDVLKKALDIEVDSHSLFDSFQVTYNIFDQSLGVVAEEIANRDKRLVIKEALANGRVFPNNSYPHYQKTYSKLDELKDKYNVGIDAIALRFCVDSIPVFKVLSGAANEEHLIDNLKAINFQLDEEDIAELRNQAVMPDFYWNERKQLNWN